MNVLVAYATPYQQVEIAVEVAANATLAVAIRRSGILEQFAEIDMANITVGINSRKVKLDDLVQQDDRIEIYRPLIIDPKQARRLRAKKS